MKWLKSIGLWILGMPRDPDLELVAGENRGRADRQAGRPPAYTHTSHALVPRAYIRGYMKGYTE